MPEAPSKVAVLITQQIHNELFAHMQYLAMSAFFEHGAFTGFAAWFRRQAAEEHNHAMKFYDFLIERGNNVILKGVEAPKTEFKSPAEVFRLALQQERNVTKNIHAIYDVAQKEKDFATLEALNWFLKEQVEEEDSVGEMLDKVELAGSDSSALLFLDHEAGEGEKA